MSNLYPSEKGLTTAVWVAIFVVIIAIVAGGALLVTQAPAPAPTTTTTPITTTTTPATTTTTPQEAKALWIGHIDDLTSSLYLVGQSYMHTFAVLEREINNAGGVEIGGEDYLIHIKSYDMRNVPDEALMVAKEIVEIDGFPIVIEGASSTCAMAIAPYLAEHKDDLIYLAPGPGTSALTENYGDQGFLFRNRTEVSTLGYGAGLYWTTTGGCKKIAYIGVRADFNTSLVQGLERGVAEGGGEIVSAQWYNYGEVEFGPYLDLIIAAKPDLVMQLGADSASQRPQLNQMIDKGMKDLMKISVWGGGASYYAEVVGEERMTGIYNIEESVYNLKVQQGDPMTVALKEKVEAYGDTFWDHHVFAYDAVQILITALQKAGTTDVNTLKETYKNLTVSDIEGKTISPFRPADDEGHLFGPKGQALSLGAIVVYENTKWVPLATMG